MHPHDFYISEKDGIPNPERQKTKQLPGQSGHDICLKLKSDEVTSSIPIILMSAANYLNETAMSCGADAYIDKPFDIDDLATYVKMLLVDKD